MASVKAMQQSLGAIVGDVRGNSESVATGRRRSRTATPT